MAENSVQEKTEQPTAKRLSKAREEGQVAKSQELNSVCILFVALMMLSSLSSHFLSQFIVLFKTFYQEVGSISINESSIQYHLSSQIKFFAGLLVPFLVVLTIAGVGVNVAQTGFLFTTKPLIPKFNKINPISGFKKFFSLKSLTELLKGILKLLVVGTIAYWTLWGEKEHFFLLVNESVRNILSFIGELVYKVVIRMIAALFVLAIFDLIYQRWQHNKDLKMSKEEVKDEAKEGEVDARVKNAMRSIQLTKARQRMMQSVPQADVVVTNPTELAIALKYDLETMNAPIVLAKGARLIAQKIKEIAMEHDIPIYENRPLAQSLYKICEVGKEIPFELYQAIAEVFAYVYQSKHNEA